MVYSNGMNNVIWVTSLMNVRRSKEGVSDVSTGNVINQDKKIQQTLPSVKILKIKNPPVWRVEVLLSVFIINLNL